MHNKEDELAYQGKDPVPVQPEKVFVVYLYDDHGDPEFKVYRSLALALDCAHGFAAESKAHYDGMRSYVTPCNGKDGWWWYESGEERWRTCVREVELQ